MKSLISVKVYIIRIMQCFLIGYRSNIKAFAQASQTIVYRVYSFNIVIKPIKVKYDQDQVNKRMTSDSFSRATNQIMSSYILLTARVRFCVINLRRNKI